MRTLNVLVGGFFLLVASPALAGPSLEEIEEITGEALNSDCAGKIKEAAKKVGPKWKAMRKGCSALRTCKKQCRGAKRAAKKDVRSGKRDCKQECASKKGKAKRQCKKSCRKSAQKGRKKARKAVRNCKSECRGQYKNAACKTGRRAFWKSIAGVVKDAAPTCAKDAKAFFEGG
jgi:hypothetical protein